MSHSWPPTVVSYNNQHPRGPVFCLNSVMLTRECFPPGRDTFSVLALTVVSVNGWHDPIDGEHFMCRLGDMLSETVERVHTMHSTWTLPPLIIRCGCHRWGSHSIVQTVCHRVFGEECSGVLCQHWGPFSKVVGTHVWALFARAAGWCKRNGT